MTINVVTNNITNTTSAASAGIINANFSAIKAGLLKALNQESGASNTMSSDIDMDGNDLLNVTSLNGASVATLITVVNNVDSAAASAVAAAASAADASTDASAASASAASAAASATAAADSAASIGTEFEDDTFRIIDDGDNTKKVAFQISGVTTGTTRTITVPDEDITLGEGGGGLVFVTKTGAYTAVAGDAIKADMNSSAYAITLPAGVENDRIVIKPDGAGTNTLTITPDGSETFNDTAGSLTVVDDVMISLLKDAASNWEVTISPFSIGGTNALLASNNLGDVDSASTSRTNLGIPGYFLGNNGTVGSGRNGDIFRANDDELTSDTTIPAGTNASTTGPLTVGASTTLTVTGTLVIL